MSLCGIKLRYYTDDEIRALSVVKVTNSGTYDRGVPKLEGLNDPRLGLVDHTIRCPTCFKSNCDQHYGHIELVRPVYRVGIINVILMILRSVCRECAKPKFMFVDDDTGTTGVGTLTAITNANGTIANNSKSGVPIPMAIQKSKNSKEKLRYIADACRNKMTCNWCGAPQPVYSRRARAFIDATYRSKELSSDFVKARGPKYLKFLKTRFMPDDTASILWALDSQTKLNLDLDRPESLVMHLQLVPPPNIRPSNFVGETKVRSENDMTCALQDIVRTNMEFQDFLDGSEKEKQSYEGLYDKLQVMVSGLVNNAIKRSAAQSGILPMISATSKRKIIDLRTRLNGKKARVRGNLNGKRVDQSARTVISGDSTSDIDVLGVPSNIMNKLTFPEPVTDQNILVMSACVIRGAYVNNGALAVKPPNCAASDTVFWLPILDHEGRIELASQLRPGWIVERHLIENDWILFNRQPTLWKASMMAFRCKRVEGLTIRVPLVVTRAFNADFDGDEMNLHSLQGYEAIAEAQELMRVDNQIITPQSGTVVIGLVQDALVGAWRLTSQDCFFGFDEALQLLMNIHYEVPGKSLDASEEEYMASVTSKTVERSSFDLQWPAVFTRTKKFWTGKQLASLLLPSKINLHTTETNILSDYNKANALVVKHGQILCGRLSKASLGASNRGLIQGIWRLYGPGGSHKFISDAQRLFVSHLDHDGPTQSILDCLSAEESKTLALLGRDLGRSDSILSLNLPKEIKEAKSISILQETLRAVGSSVLQQVRSDCALADCVNSGSKGNVMNIAQIGGCVGQQTVYGKRVPVKQTRLGPRTLIYYAPGDLRAEARGFIANSYIRGLSPIETFEHQMAGREGIVATAVNTSETGYNQRRMIKGQESQRMGYDGMVRVSDNKIVQFSYGGDDLDGSRLERIKFNWLTEPKKYLIEKYGHEIACGLLKCTIVKKALRMALKYTAWNANLYKELDPTFACAVNLRALLVDSTYTMEVKKESFMTLHAYESILSQLLKQIMSIHSRHHAAKQAFWNTSIIAVILQAVELIDHLSPESLDKITKMYAISIIAPGEGVGALGASSIGEPSMQKTLNTFHYAGIADKNVTITGLPRFKQLINGVDTYETANMTAKLRNFEDTRSALQISRVMLYDILDSDIEIQHITIKDSRFKRLKSYFELLNDTNQKCPFAQKFSKVREQRGHSEQSVDENFYAREFFDVLKLNISWTLCARKNLTLDTVAKSLRSLFSFDACIIKEPHWSSDKASSILVVLAPWLDGTKAICDALKMQHQVRGLDYIKNAICFQETRYADDLQKVSGHVVETEGSNVVHLASCSFIEPETVRTNNVLEAFSTFGISAGTMVLQSELHLVLSFDGSYIDPRHTWLLADTMGRNGTLAAMNRHHMLDLGSSLLQEASFERSLEVFEEGAAHGRTDALVGATERIIVGQPVGIGTGLVEIIYTQKTPEQLAQTMVKPLYDKNNEMNFDSNIISNNSEKNDDEELVHEDYEGHEGHEGIGPLHQKTKKVYSPEAFSCLLMDHSKHDTDTWMHKCVITFRQKAAEKRVLPILKFTKTISYGYYLTVIDACKSAQWTIHEQTNLKTEVHWLNKTSFGLTTVTNETRQSFHIETYYIDSNKHTSCEICLKNALEPVDVPFGVESTRIIMRNESVHIKNGFSLTLARQWTGTTNTECESEMLKGPGTFVAILELIDPESILQNRCSDVQLANAIKLRLP